MIRKYFTIMKINNRFVNDEKAVSVSVDHVLGIAILLVITGVFLNGVTSSFTERESIIIEKELDRVTENVANELVKTDSMIEHSKVNNDATDEIKIENRILTQSVLYKNGYTITVKEENGDTIITGMSGDVTVQTEIKLENEVNDFGGSGVIIVKYDGNDLTLNNP